jgi:hypothetical protein
VNARSAEKSEETVVIRKEKEPKRKENRPAGKVENAMKPRFPLSHRACHHRPNRPPAERTRTKKDGGLSAAIIDRRTYRSGTYPDPGD